MQFSYSVIVINYFRLIDIKGKPVLNLSYLGEYLFIRLWILTGKTGSIIGRVWA